mmetsp:Transcript_41809/g.135293  ORF Transcript_41809/g.135293 Transcript_41809/m.135293 type:complete len:255 (-) Transcript_41809:157-921(-)
MCSSGQIPSLGRSPWITRSASMNERPHMALPLGEALLSSHSDGDASCLAIAHAGSLCDAVVKAGEGHDAPGCRHLHVADGREVQVRGLRMRNALEAESVLDGSCGLRLATHAHTTAHALAPILELVDVLALATHDPLLQDVAGRQDSVVADTTRLQGLDEASGPVGPLRDITVEDVWDTGVQLHGQLRGVLPRPLLDTAAPVRERLLQVGHGCPDPRPRPAQHRDAAQAAECEVRQRQGAGGQQGSGGAPRPTP